MINPKNFFILVLLGLFSCQPLKLEKVKFPLEKLDKNGLIGPQDGKVALDYVFCIPNKKEFKNEVLSISSSIKIDMKNSFFCKGKGRVSCFGNTGQKGFKRTLRKLNALNYVETIESVDWE